jgi:hypothetical protein
MRREDAEAFVAIQERSYATAGQGIRASYPRSHAMDADRLLGFLREHRYAVLATARPDGRPQAAPVSYLVWGGAFWFALVAGARERALRSNPYAALVIAEGEGRDHRAVVAEGPVALYDPADLDRIGPEFSAAWQDRFRERPTWAALLAGLRPARLYSFDATPGDRG